MDAQELSQRIEQAEQDPPDRPPGELLSPTSHVDTPDPLD